MRKERLRVVQRPCFYQDLSALTISLLRKPVLVFFVEIEFRKSTQIKNTAIH